MSDTPRTDKAEYEVRLGKHRRMVVRPELCRDLERELGKIKAVLKDPAEVELAMIRGDIAIPHREEFDGIRDTPP